ncbi:hypothetical protein H257_05228 [Aphanomyces astaci]|uniref:Calcineurin-like phosphoesterase domain-containing protein n=1 Tax=Aphanomyces astaci TaxID=112090 RepID=W4GUS7_APHAT|nr:hypothetical protein H257_05228 [Aphanomyces astaci]ETV82658.1 hypothetical protein H257_05228 [Aphanomyces astaci]|eukprot:XP_009828327.1 hypothetical protein H257_05228 [Aphanomyces astaci]
MVDMKASTATFKVVNTHYSPHYHMNSSQMMQWYTLCREAGVTVWFNSHTHSFNHDIATWGTHFFENGGGGYWTRNLPGMNKGLVKKLAASAIATFDDQWTFGGMDMDATVVGGLLRGYCWFIPRMFQAHGGVECRASVNVAMGAHMED